MLAISSQISNQFLRSALPRSFSSLSSNTTGQQQLVLYYNDVFEVPLPEGHRFPMQKYKQTRLTLQDDPSLKGLIEFRQSPFATVNELKLTHDRSYINRFLTGQMTQPEMRNVGFPYSQHLVSRTLSSAGGTVAALRCIYEEGARMAGHIAGGTHHAFKDWGEGFCVFNDISVATRIALTQYGVQNILILDLDVHQGNGTADTFHDEPRVTTFDMNGARNYPWKTRRKNTYDVLLEDGTGDEQYLDLLESWLPKLECHRQELVIFQAGVDALAGDRFGRLNMSRQGLIKRNNLVYSFVLQLGVPLVITMGGGYGKDQQATVDAHSDVYRTAAYRLQATSFGSNAAISLAG